MRRSAAPAALLGVLVLTGAALTSLVASGQAAAVTTALHRVRVTGLDRAGKTVSAIDAVLLENNGFTYRTAGRAVYVPTGSYLIAGTVPTGAAGQTLVVRRVTIGQSETIRLNAEPGRL